MTNGNVLFTKSFEQSIYNANHSVFAGEIINQITNIYPASSNEIKALNAFYLIVLRLTRESKTQRIAKNLILSDAIDMGIVKIGIDETNKYKTIT